jgi:hypothetical protein
MNAITAFPCIITVILVTLTVPGQSETNTVFASDRGPAPTRGQDMEKPGTARKADPSTTPGGTRSTGKPQHLTAPDQSQVVEERLRSGQMEKPIAQGEVSDRLNQLYSGSNSPVH